ncbi:hypothetical protein OAF83_03290 [Rubripirellula sp.]|nr:hypothetical protein [Rubripirellula sp.]MDB4749911.1 hypothetical protein [Rubripirellula sp.]
MHGVWVRSQRIAPQAGTILSQTADAMLDVAAVGDPRWFYPAAESTHYLAQHESCQGGDYFPNGGPLPIFVAHLCQPEVPG